MEKIGNIGWFLTDEEMAKLEEAFDALRTIMPGFEDGLNSGPADLTHTGDKVNSVPYTPNQGIGINEPCPQCPWKNPADWMWRPWQAPWYGPGDPIPTKWEIGDGEWWKHQPYCTTSTSADNPDGVNETITAKGNKEINEDFWKELRGYKCQG